MIDRRIARRVGKVARWIAIGTAALASYLVLIMLIIVGRDYFTDPPRTEAQQRVTFETLARDRAASATVQRVAEQQGSRRWERQAALRPAPGCADECPPLQAYSAYFDSPNSKSGKICTIAAALSFNDADQLVSVATHEQCQPALR